MQSNNSDKRQYKCPVEATFLICETIFMCVINVRECSADYLGLQRLTLTTYKVQQANINLGQMLVVARF